MSLRDAGDLATPGEVRTSLYRVVSMHIQDTSRVPRSCEHLYEALDKYRPWINDAILHDDYD